MSLSQASPIYMARPTIGEDEIREVVAVLGSGLLSEGETVRRFEEEFAGYIGTRYAVAVNSGTAALTVALMAHGIGAGDEVITTPFTFIATANSILSVNARPVFADICPDTFNIDPAQVEEAITPATRAIMPVHLYGQSCDMDALTDIAQRHGLIIIEDACQAHGAEYRGRKVGTFGTGCFSFYPTKNMTTGEGGMVTTDDADLAQRARMARNHGQIVRYHHENLGYNFRMTNIAGAIGLCQLAKLPRMNAIRTANAGTLTDGLMGITGIEPPLVSPHVHHVYHQYTLRLTDRFPVSRDKFREALRARGVSTEVYYPVPLHQQPIYRKLGYADRLPVSEQASREVVSLPVHPSLSEQDLRHIIESITGLV